jgi:chemotaxis protein histidine kinase CheA
VRLYELFGIEPQYTDLLDGLLMIVEADGKRVGLFVDELMSQQQVVIRVSRPTSARWSGSRAPPCWVTGASR